MEKYQREFALLLAESGALFFDRGLRLKDGRPSPYFVNMGLFRTGRLSAILGSFMARLMVSQGLADRTDVIVGPSYKGSAIAVATAQALWTEHGRDILFDYDRKEAKQHGEATRAKAMFVTNALFPGCRVFIVDDVASTMKTKYDLLELLNEESAARGLDLTVIGIGLGIDRQQTTAVYDADGRLRENVKGQNTVADFTARTGLPVHFLAAIRDVIDFLAETGTPVMINGRKQPLDRATLDEFAAYMAVYGVPLE